MFISHAGLCGGGAEGPGKCQACAHAAGHALWPHESGAKNGFLPCHRCASASFKLNLRRFVSEDEVFCIHSSSVHQHQPQLATRGYAWE